MPQLYKIGEWKRVERLTSMLGREMKKAQRKSLVLWGSKVERIAKGHINKQDLGWTPLSKAYLAKKKSTHKTKGRSLSNNILVATGSYFNSITNYVVNDTVYAGVRKMALDDNGKEIANIARVHEYGYAKGGIPARPLWTPSLKEAIVWHAKHNRPEAHFKQAMLKY